jgi:hypothetical protein
MRTPTSLARAQRSRAGAMARHHGNDDPRTIEAKQQVAATMLEKHIRQVVESAPALTAAQRVELARLLLTPTSESTGGPPYAA